MNIYTADPHFGHANILRLCDRPFADLDAMHSHYIETFREAVGPDDDLWILGDLAYGRSAARLSAITAIFDALPGRKHLVAGNHDGPRIRGLSWTSVHELVEIRDGDQLLVLCHYPLLSWNRAQHGALHLFGHVHGDHRGYRGAVNVGLDVWDHRPVRLNEIRVRSESLGPNPVYG